MARYEAVPPERAITNAGLDKKIIGHFANLTLHIGDCWLMTLSILVHQFFHNHFNYLEMDIFNFKYKGFPNRLIYWKVYILVKLSSNQEEFLIRGLDRSENERFALTIILFWLNLKFLRGKKFFYQPTMYQTDGASAILTLHIKLGSSQ